MSIIKTSLLKNTRLFSRSRTGGISDDQRRSQQDGADGQAVQEAPRSEVAAASQANSILAHGGQGRSGVGGHGQIIKADNTQIPGNLNPSVAALGHGGEGPYIMGEQYSRNAVVQQFGDIGSGGFRYKVSQANVVLIDLKTVLFQGAQISVIPCLQDIGVQGA